MRVALSRFGVAIAIVALGTSSASAQFIGAFSWQLQPYCNVLTLNVTQQGGIFTLDGFDDQCGAATRASATGVAFPNPDGTIGIGLAIVVTPGSTPVHVDATISLATVSGTWRDSLALAGTFGFNSATGGAFRSTSPGSVVTGYGINAQFLGRMARGTPAAPLPPVFGQPLVSFGGRGFTGGTFSPGMAAAMRIVTTENWSPTTTGAAFHFFTTANGTAIPSLTPRLVIDHDGQVGIGTAAPSELLHVVGNVRIGSCVYETDGGVLCVSDARFKRAVSPLPRVLDRLVALEPVQYSWRADEFPERGFDRHESAGLIAQDAERAMPDLVTTDAQGYKAVNYGKLPLLAIQAIKELKAKNDTLEQDLVALKALVSELAEAVRHR